jgi:(R)-2-hydroxyacyl-CoA dehydratese activating ATPase
MICAGIDAGSRAIKVVLYDTDRRAVAAQAIAPQGIAQAALAASVFQQALDHAGLTRQDLTATVATGYGRGKVPAATAITEITCHARGVRHVAPEARTIVEIGGQDSKVIWLEAGGHVRDFSMNDRCAAGTGRFLEIVAERLGTPLEALGELSRSSLAPALISSTCAVFAETEMVGLLAEGTSPADIAAGVLQAVASRAVTLAGQRVEEPVYFTGGVALIPGMLGCLAQAAGCPVLMPPQPQFTGALGAAILASELGLK